MNKTKIELIDGVNKCDNATYHADRNYLSSSVLKTVLKSLDQYYLEYIMGEKKEFSSSTLGSFDDGTLAHAYILEPHTLLTDFNYFKGFRKAGPEYQAFLASAKAGLPIISAPQKHRVEQWINAYKKHPIAPTLIEGGEAEQTICGELHGIPIKTRTDYINADKGYIVDVKTTAYPVDVDSFKLTMESLSYDLSSALYLEMAEKYYGKRFDFYFIVLGKKDNQCAVFKLSEQTRLAGARKVATACAKYKKAKETKVWTELVSSGNISAVIDNDAKIEEV